MEALSNIVYEKRSLEYQLASITDLTDRIDFEITTRSIEKIVTPGDYRDATIFRNEFYDFKKKVEEFRKKAVAPINEQKQKIQDAFNPLLDKLQNAINNLNLQLSLYQKEQDRLNKEAEEKRAAEEAERKRVYAEKIKAAQTQEELAAVMKEKDTAEKELEQAPAPIVTQTKADKSVAITTNYRVEVVDPAALIAFLAQRPEFVSWVSFKDKEISKYLKMTDGKVEIPGTKVFKEESVKVRRTRTKKAEVVA